MTRRHGSSIRTAVALDRFQQNDVGVDQEFACILEVDSDAWTDG
jgi:hypothetical protein